MYPPLDMIQVQLKTTQRVQTLAGKKEEKQKPDKHAFPNNQQINQKI